jgi:multicomponent Na+:H+ antiporter subunit E
MALTGKFSATNFFFGFVLAFGILWLIAREKEDRNYFFKIPKYISFFFFFLKELIKSNIQVGYDVITPRFFMTPGIVGVPLSVKSDAEITLLANLITLTPGTLSLDVSEDKSTLFVHVMYLKDREEFINSIKNGFERRIMELFQ